MAHAQTYNDILKRISDRFDRLQPAWGEVETALVTIGGVSSNMHVAGWTRAMPDPLPSGVSRYFLLSAWLTSSISGLCCLLAKAVNLGSLDIATPTFTDGVQMPTVTELGVSRQVASAIIVEVTTPLNSAPGNLTVTYVDQDGNTAETTASQALGASAPVRSGGWVVLNAPDWGVRDVTTASRSGGTSPTGVVKFWGLVPLMMFPIAVGQEGAPDVNTALTEGFNLSPLGAADTVGIFLAGSTAIKHIVGELYVVGDST